MAVADYKSFPKEPSEEFDITQDVAPLLRKGATISSMLTGYPKATQVSNGADMTATVLGSNAFSGTVITQRVKAGLDGEKYKIEWFVQDSNGEKHEDGLIMEVIAR